MLTQYLIGKLKGIVWPGLVQTNSSIYQSEMLIREVLDKVEIVSAKADV